MTHGYVWVRSNEKGVILNHVVKLKKVEHLKGLKQSIVTDVHLQDRDQTNHRLHNKCC